MTTLVEAALPMPDLITDLPIKRLRRGETVMLPSGVNVKVQGRRAIIPVQLADGSVQLKRPQNGDEKNLADQLRKLLAIVHNPQTWECAAVLPNEARTGTRGRHATHPRWVVLLLLGATQITGSQRSAVALLENPYLWGMINLEVEKARPAHLPPAGHTPPTRSNFRTLLKYLESRDGSEHFQAMRVTLRNSSIAAARACGHLNPDTPLKFKELDFGQWVAYDGTVYAPAARKGKRIDESAGDQLRCGEPGAYGSKVVFGSIRGTDFQSRWIVDFEQVLGQTETGVGDEAKAIEASALRVKAEAPGLRGIIVDSIIRGILLSELARQGILTVNFPHAASNRKRTTAGRLNDSRKDKVGKLPLHKHLRPSGGTCSHTMRVRGGVYQMQVLNDDGNTIWQDLEVLGYKGGRPDSDGNHRWYHVVSVPCQYQAQTVLIPLFHEPRAKMKGQKLNRGEHFRFYPQNTEQHQILYGRRNDTESLHRQLKRTMDRMPAYSAQRQAIFLLGVQLAHNSMTMAFERRRAGLPNVIDGNT